jgi:hypothetical protein
MSESQEGSEDDGRDDEGGGEDAPEASGGPVLDANGFHRGPPSVIIS